MMMDPLVNFINRLFVNSTLIKMMKQVSLGCSVSSCPVDVCAVMGLLGHNSVLVIVFEESPYSCVLYLNLFTFLPVMNQELLF